MSVPLAMVAGEASGDLLAALLLDGLHRRIEGLRAYGIGGPQMAARGFDAHWPIEKLAVRGYAEVLRHLPEIYGIRRRLLQQLLGEPPAAFVGVDAPDFNFGLERKLRDAWRGQHRPVVHFIGPSIWAWRGGRIRKIARAVDHMLVLLPFEPKIYADAGIAATYVGHPLADVIPMVPDRAAARVALGIDDGVRVVAILPGSRLSEIDYNARLFLDAAAILAGRHPDVRFVAPTAGAAAHARLAMIAKEHPLPLTLVDGRSHEVLAACDAVLVASGTATLEAALSKRPMVVAYRIAGTTAFLMRRIGYIPYVALPNILAGAFVVPEFLQDDATPAAIATALEHQLIDPRNRRELEERFTSMHEALRCGTGDRAAEVIARLISRKN